MLLGPQDFAVFEEPVMETVSSDVILYKKLTLALTCPKVIGETMLSFRYGSIYGKPQQHERARCSFLLSI